MATLQTSETGLFNQAISTCSLAAHRANHFPSRDCVAVLQTHAETSCLHILHSLNICGLNGLCGKTSPEFCRADEEGILEPSSGRWGNWGTGSPTECLTLNGCEHSGTHAPSRSAEGVCSLSRGEVCSLTDVLETQPVPQRFYLSEKACSGILRRAERRGKILPEQLRRALESAVTTSKSA